MVVPRHGRRLIISSGPADPPADRWVCSQRMIIGAAGAALLAACSGPAPVRVTAPDPPAAGCGRLHAELPEGLDDRDRRDTTPASRRTAAWGDPPVTLRCGVPRPAGLTATSEVIEVNAVEWFLAESPRAYVFTTVGRRTYVELRVPASTPREQATNPLVDLAAAVRTAVPEV